MGLKDPRDPMATFSITPRMPTLRFAPFAMWLFATIWGYAHIGLRETFNRRASWFLQEADAVRLTR